jgi:lysophospholipase L1-like esterase
MTLHRHPVILVALALMAGTLVAATEAPAAPTTAPATAPATAPRIQLPIPPADKPSIRLDAEGNPAEGWMHHHEANLKIACKGNIDLYFEGDSITDSWAGRAGRDIWAKEFGAWNPGNFGISGDRTNHVLWRLDHHELDGVSPKVYVLMIGTNNRVTKGVATVESIAHGVELIVKKFQEHSPNAKILLLAIFPRGATPNDIQRKQNDEVNKIIAKLDDGKNVKFLDIGQKFLDADGNLSKEIMPDLLHPGEKGYQIWADAIKPTLTEWLGAAKQNP